MAGDLNPTRLILEVFRLKDQLDTAGDALVEDLSLTSARWRVLGAVAVSPAACTVAHLARSMGLSRQGVQRIVNDMRADDLLALSANPQHRRAQLVVLTPKGRAAYDEAGRRRIPWMGGLSEGLSADDLRTAVRVLKAMGDRLEA